jgi:hypothetical protein
MRESWCRTLVLYLPHNVRYPRQDIGGPSRKYVRLAVGFLPPNFIHKIPSPEPSSWWCNYLLVCHSHRKCNLLISSDFLMANSQVSGLRVLSFNKYTRRDRFVLAAAMSFGIGDLLAPQMFTHLFDGVNNPNSALEGFFNSITIILSTPCKFRFVFQLAIPHPVL